MVAASDPTADSLAARWAILIHTPSDQEWTDWLEKTWPDEESFILMLTAPGVGQHQQARAIMHLLTPDVRWLPFPTGSWGVELVGSTGSDPALDRVRMLDFDASWIGSIPTPLLAFTQDVLSTYTHMLDRGADTMPDDIGSQLTRTLRGQLNYHLLELMPCVDLPQALELLKLYNLLDPHPVCWVDDGSGYRPFTALMAHSGIGSELMLAADLRMRLVVTAETKRVTKPRASHEQAPAWYLRCISDLVSGSPFYSLQLLSSQLLFVMELTAGLQDVNFEPVTVGRMLDVLSPTDSSEATPDHYANLRKQLIAYVLRSCDDHHELRLHGEVGVALGHRMLAELADDNPPCSELLQQLITDCGMRLWRLPVPRPQPALAKKKIRSGV
jgi:hypothetical protein